MGSSSIVNKKAESLENRNNAFNSIPHITAMIIMSIKTIMAGRRFIFKLWLFNIKILQENTTITQTLSNNEDKVFPNITANLFAGERYMYSRVPATLSKEKFQAD
jgi:hypothetical protein